MTKKRRRPKITKEIRKKASANLLKEQEEKKELKKLIKDMKRNNEEFLDALRERGKKKIGEDWVRY